jgi:hypothetical protein
MIISRCRRNRLSFPAVLSLPAQRKNQRNGKAATEIVLKNRIQKLNVSNSSLAFVKQANVLHAL